MHITLNVYNVNGQLVKELENTYKRAGAYKVIFNGAGLASGVYFYRIKASNLVKTKRMLLLK